MLTKEEFHAWCHRLQLPKATEELIASIRTSPSVRKVRGHASNVTGRYPSPKMQLTIQFESQHLDRTTPRHGECPFAIAHLDHKEWMFPRFERGKRK